MERLALTLKQAADLLSCHSSTLRRAIQNQSLKAAKLGADYRVSMAELCEFWKLQGGGSLLPQEKQGEALEMVELEVVNSEFFCNECFEQTAVEGVLISKETGRVALMLPGGSQAVLIGLKK